jgi:hypothetical protein
MNDFTFIENIEISAKNWLLNGLMTANSLNMISGLNGEINSQVATEIALSLGVGKTWYGRCINLWGYEERTKCLTTYITLNCDHTLVRRQRSWNESNGVHENSLFGGVSLDYDCFFDTDSLNELIDNIKQEQKKQQKLKALTYPTLIVIDIANWGQNEVLDKDYINQFIKVVNYIRSKILATFLLVFNKGNIESDAAYKTLLNIVDTAFKVKSFNNCSAIRFSCTKMSVFDKPKSFDFVLSCDAVKESTVDNFYSSLDYVSAINSEAIDKV